MVSTGTVLVHWSFTHHYFDFCIELWSPDTVCDCNRCLAFSDALAALMERYGRVHYHAAGEQRSVEAQPLFISTFVVVHLPLLLLTDRSCRMCSHRLWNGDVDHSV